MKKTLLMMSLVLLLGVCAVGCDSVKNDVYKEEEVSQTRMYEHMYEEEIEGTVYALRNTIILNEDGTGKIQLQDVFNLTYDEENITLETGDVYSYKIDGETLTLNYDGNVMDFSLSK